MQTVHTVFAVVQPTPDIAAEVVFTLTDQLTAVYGAHLLDAPEVMNNILLLCHLL